MTLTIEVPEKLVERASELGVSVKTLVQSRLEAIAEEPMPAGFAPIGQGSMTPQEAGTAIRGIASRNVLGGLAIKDLINEGRRY